MTIANLTDMSLLAVDTTFGSRVMMGIVLYCSSTVLNEAITAATLGEHVARKNFAGQILNNQANFKSIFVNMVACNQIVANEATTNGTLVGAANVATQAALCLDADINNAIAAAFNALIAGI